MKHTKLVTSMAALFAASLLLASCGDPTDTNNSNSAGTPDNSAAITVKIDSNEYQTTLGKLTSLLESKCDSGTNYNLSFKANLTDASFGELLNNIGEVVNWSNLNVSSLDLSGITGATVLGESVFQEQKLTGISTLKLPSSITTINDYAFSYCSELTSIEIPAATKSIGSGIFYRAEKLANVTVAEGNTAFVAVDNVLYTADKKILIAGAQTATTVALDNATTEIASAAFAGSSKLKSVTNTKNLVKIADKAFDECSALTSIDISSVTEIGASAFYETTSLASIALNESITVIPERLFYKSAFTSFTIPSKTTKIGDRAFLGTKLTSIEIPESVTEIGEATFQSCDKLTNVTVMGTTPPALAQYVFRGTSAELKIYVPSSAVETYKAHDSWTEYADKIAANPVN